MRVIIKERNEIKALNLLKEEYDKQYKKAGFPHQYCVNEPLFYAIKKLEQAIETNHITKHST